LVWKLLHPNNNPLKLSLSNSLLRPSHNSNHVRLLVLSNRRLLNNSLPSNALLLSSHAPPLSSRCPNSNVPLLSSRCPSSSARLLSNRRPSRHPNSSVRLD
ncbi:hypothetical protein GGH92_004774, partial [Coemansia sp. RSA 2673]